MNREKRLLKNLDGIDKHIATAEMTLFFISLLYIALLLNVSTELKVPGLDLRLPKAYALFIGCPLILIVFQYITIAVLAMLRVEESLAAEGVDAMESALRTPTVFSMMFMTRETAEARRSRIVLVAHTVVVFGCLFLLPAVTCTAMSVWLLKNAGRPLSLIGLACAVGCFLEIGFVSFETDRRLRSIRLQRLTNKTSVGGLHSINSQSIPVNGVIEDVQIERVNIFDSGSLTEGSKMKGTKTENETVTIDELDHLKQVCEYIKFHIGLYLATPSVIVLLADGLNITKSAWFGRSIGLMILIFLVSGISAGSFMGTYVNQPLRDDEMRRQFYNEAYSLRRRILQHWLYWFGLTVGFAGLLVGWFGK